MKGKIITIVLVILLIAGAGIALYPMISNYWNLRFASRVIATYSEQIVDMNQEEFDEMWEAAIAYNTELAKKERPENLTEKEWEEYLTILDINGTGIMGYLEIEKLRIRLPIYHGTDESVLQTAAGHMEWTSLPVGGTSSHCVIAAHSGLPSAKLFSDLEDMKEGDTFCLHVLNRKLEYVIDQIEIVNPEEIKELQIVKGEEYCTLVTCTPYGINTHRLLVRGERRYN